MPELPEVEANRRLLTPLAGRRVTAVHVPDPTSVRPALSTKSKDAGGAERLTALVGQVAAVPTRRGKRLGWTFGPHGLLAHLGMTGRFVVANEAPRWAKVGITFDDGRTVWFVDPRRFGCVVPVDAAQVAPALADGLGPDALDDPQSGAQLAARFVTPRAIKVALLDQDRLAGMGNIHAVEALWRAHLHPDTRGVDLDTKAWDALAAAITTQLHHGLALVEADGIAYLSDGVLTNPFEVYGRAGEPCRRCGGRIQGEVRAGRSTFWCPDCQPAPPKSQAATRSARSGRDGGARGR